ncbi:MAG: winged helix-turn-helix domain-containing protein [Clostridia bacterium]
MKIAISIDNSDFINAFHRKIKERGDEIQNLKVETNLFDCIDANPADAYILSNNLSFTKKAIDFLKKSNPYIPIILLYDENVTALNISRADIILNYNKETILESFVLVTLHNINNYIKNFETLNKLTAKMHDIIEFNNCKYDPTRRILYYKGKEVQKLSTKQGGVIEILAVNYGTVVKKDIILEKVWHECSYFTGRSLDVYITHIRNLFRDNNIDIQIKNISNVGLILE